MLMNEDRWPDLSRPEWKETYPTLHMWTQVVGKVALALSPPLNHSWGIALQVTSRGLSTRLLPYGQRAFTIEFDFVAQELVILCSDGGRRTLTLEPRSVADFYRAVMSTLEAMSLPVRVWPVAVELPEPIRFESDDRSFYDPDSAAQFWRLLVSLHRLFTAASCDFIGKKSPVHFFWGAFDLAVTRFSGRTAPPREGPEWMQEAYSHEVISHGFWPGSGLVPEAAFYAYAVPEPAGLKEAPVEPKGAYYHAEMGEFILPYEEVRNSRDREAAIAAFIATTYERAATLGGWDRAALERK
jgi:hypothetical protein